MHRIALFAATAALLAAGATPAGAAETILLTEDAEGAPDVRWTLNAPPEGVEPWQPSDSEAQKYRGNMFHGGAKSFWSGVQPQNWPPVPTTAPAGATVIEGESILTLKTPLLIPADGTSQIKYWSLFQNEGDDQGILQAALADTGTAGTWKNLKVEAAVNTAAGDTDPRACDPSRPDHTTAVPFEEQKVSLAPYAGHKVLLRFNLKYGAENRPVSHPCGWYLDDITVVTTGTPGAAAPGAPKPAGPPTPGSVPTVTLGAVKLKGKKGTLSLTVKGGDINSAKVSLLKGKKVVGTGSAKSLAIGKRSVVLKLKGKVKKGRYTAKFTAKSANGVVVKATRAVKAR